MKKNILLTLLILLSTASASISQVTYTYPMGPFSALYDGQLIEADYWDSIPRILSAGVGFCDIVGVDAPALDQNVVMQAGGAWLTDISCGVDDADFTSTSRAGQVQAVYIYQNEPWLLEDGALGMDGLPVVFSWPVLSNTIDVTDFRFILNTGDTITPYAAGLNPNYENNERNCVVIFGELANRLPSTDPLARFPVKCEIVDDGTPLLLAGPNDQVVSAVGLSWGTTTSPYDPNNGPRLVGAKLNHVGSQNLGEGTNNPTLDNLVFGVFPNDEFALYNGGDFRLRVLTTGGFSPDGVRGVLPTDFERFFRIHAIAPNDSTILLEKTDSVYTIKGGTLKILGLSDLGQRSSSYDDCYDEDRDNYIDIIIEGDEEAARQITHIEIPSLAGGYDAFYNPGGPGSTPFPGVAYTSPGPPDLEPVIMALDDPMRVTYDINTPSISSIDAVTYNIFNLPIFPEGLEYDSDRDAFIISSALGGAINLIRADGSFANLVPTTVFNGNGTFGLQIDTLNNRLLAVGTNLQNPTTAWLFRFDLGNGALIDSIDLAALIQGPGLNFVNDVAVDHESNAYVTNSDRGIIFKVDTNGEASIFFQDDRFTPPIPLTQTGFNGIEYHEDGYLLVSHYVSNKIYKIMIDNPAVITEVSLPNGYVRGGDGMYLDDDELVVVNNAATDLNGNPAAPFVARFRSNDNWNSAVAVGDTYATGDVFPTTVVKVEDNYFINYAYFNYLAYGNTPVNYAISKANFDFDQRYSGSAMEIPRVNTPILPFSYGQDYPASYYSDCTTPIADAVPDLRGDWIEAAVTINGTNIPPQPNPRQERIEQCGNRILITSDGVLHEVFEADSTMFNGVNDVDPSGQPLHFTGSFTGDVFILSPRIPDTTQTVPDITREIIQDDDGNDVLRLFNPLLGGTRYLVEDTGIVSTENLTATNFFKVAPNPFRDQTLVSWNNVKEEPFQAQLLNITGQIVKRYSDIKGESLLIDQGGLLPGIYFLNIIDGAGNSGTLKLLLLE